MASEQPKRSDGCSEVLRNTEVLVCLLQKKKVICGVSDYNIQALRTNLMFILYFLEYFPHESKWTNTAERLDSGKRSVDGLARSS